MNESVNEESADRRDFLRISMKSAAGVAIVLVAGDTAWVNAETVSQEPGEKGKVTYNPRDHHYVFLVDITKCIGCGACVRACERENDVPPNYFRTWIERYRVARNGEVSIDSPNGGRGGFAPDETGREITKAFFVPKLCNHCTATPCVQLCPVGASYRTVDGVILVDAKRCIGCSYCVQACPYGSRFIHPETHVATKCTLCYHRITKGLDTACVHICPTGARKFGDRKAMGDEVSDIIATHQVRILKPELHTQSNCFYIGMSGEVR